MKTRPRGRGRRRERGLIRSLSCEKKRVDRCGPHYRVTEVAPPITVSRTRRTLSSEGTRQVVTYRQSSWPLIRKIVSDESSLSNLVALADDDVDESDVMLRKRSNRSEEQETKVIQLSASETGAYVYRPSTFCNLFETAYCPGDEDSVGSNNKYEDKDDVLAVTETSSFETAAGKVVFCPNQVEGTTGGCGSFGVIFKILEDSFDSWFSYPELPSLLQVSSSGESTSASSTNKEQETVTSMTPLVPSIAMPIQPTRRAIAASAPPAAPTASKSSATTRTKSSSGRKETSRRGTTFRRRPTN